MEIIKLRDEYIKLGQALKAAGLVESGVDAKYAIEEGRRTASSGTWTRVIWDVTAVAWLLGEDFMADTLVHSPIPQYDHTWTPSATRHFIRYVYAIHRDRLLADLVHKLTE